MNNLSNQTPQNILLATLPTEEYQFIIQQFELVDLPLHQVIYQPGEFMKYAYFPSQGMISLVAITKENASVEIGLIGKEGMIGLPIILGGNSSISLAMVQIAGSAMRIEAKQLKAEFNKGGYFQFLLLCYIQARLTQVSQTSACNRLHHTEERLARLLLMVRDCLQADEFSMTHEYIAQMLGSRRSGITEAAGILQKAGIIRYRRGIITILSSEKLKDTACECYKIIKLESKRLFSGNK
ncbi:cyclic nucleotide-binding protein [Calothrix sp. PCC 7716]|nr:cyclic nucleotide-binding protein [Calothrix sp. PCC 7716]